MRWAGRDHKSKVTRHRDTIIGGDMSEAITGSRADNVGGNRMESTGGDHAADVSGESSELVGKTKRIQAEHIALQAETISFTNINGSISFLGLLVSLMEEVRCALHDLAMHTHPAMDSVPDNSGHIDTHAENVGGLKEKLGTIKG